MGHAFGATGAILLACCVDELERRQAGYGVAAVSGAAGLGCGGPGRAGHPVMTVPRASARVCRSRTMSGLSLDSRVAVISGAGKDSAGASRSNLRRLGAKVVVNNRNRIVDDSGRGPADHVVARDRGRRG